MNILRTALKTILAVMFLGVVLALLVLGMVGFVATGMWAAS